MNKCPHCGYRFDTPAALTGHVEYVEQYVPVLCVA